MGCLNVDNDVNLHKFNDDHHKGVWFVWFYADWCGHCKQMIEPWDQFERNNIHKVNLAKVKDDFVSRVNSNPNIQGWPTIVLYKNGKIVDIYQGSRTPDGFNDYLGNNINVQNENRNQNQPNNVVKLSKPKSLKRKKSRRSKSKSSNNSNRNNSNKVDRNSKKRKRKSTRKQSGSRKKRKVGSNRN
jgi:thiol-disulfide isomerase/thioredoxin